MHSEDMNSFVYQESEKEEDNFLQGNDLRDNNEPNRICYSSETRKYLRVNLWLAVPHFGIGYLLSDGSIGELMPDKSTLLFSRDQNYLYYYDRQHEQEQVNHKSKN